MKVDIIIDQTIDETQVKIFAKEYSKEVETIKDLLADRLIDKLVAFRDKEVFILSHEEIIRILPKISQSLLKRKTELFRQGLLFLNWIRGLIRKNLSEYLVQIL